MIKHKGRVQIGAWVRAETWAAFKTLCGTAGVSLNYGLERALLEVIQTGQIPGVEDLPLPSKQVRREAEKFGPEAVPIVDVDDLHLPK